MPAHKPSFRFILTSTMLAALLLTDCTSRADPRPLPQARAASRLSSSRPRRRPPWTMPSARGWRHG